VTLASGGVARVDDGSGPGGVDPGSDLMGPATRNDGGDRDDVQHPVGKGAEAGGRGTGSGAGYSEMRIEAGVSPGTEEPVFRSWQHRRAWLNRQRKKQAARAPPHPPD